MRNKKKKTASIFLMLLANIVLFSFSMLSVSAYNGTWTSATSLDINGVSSVGTTYTGGAGSSVIVDLYVRTSTGSNVGVKYTAARIDQAVEHTCWGEPFLERYGRVVISGYHSPWFNE